MVDYKGGKYFILQDELDEDGFDVEIGTMMEEDITDEFLTGHVDTCVYYGIPPVITLDEKLNARVNKLLKKYEE